MNDSVQVNSEAHLGAANHSKASLHSDSRLWAGAERCGLRLAVAAEPHLAGRPSVTHVFVSDPPSSNASASLRLLTAAALGPQPSHIGEVRDPSGNCSESPSTAARIGHPKRDVEQVTVRTSKIRRRAMGNVLQDRGDEWAWSQSA